MSASLYEEAEGIYICNSSAEKYLSGGWQSRLLLALKSPLANEQDWAYNKLVKLSFTQNFFIGILPSLQETLMEHAAPFFEDWVLNTSPSNFETSSKVQGQLSEISLFQDAQSAIILERILQILHIIRNLSFLPDNAVVFSRDHALLTNLAKAIALPSVSYYTEIRRHAFDIFENMSSLIHLRGPSDFYFACLRKSLFEPDRSMILTAIRALTKLTLNPVNEKVIVQLDSVTLARLLELLLIPDEELVMVTMEFFYNFTTLSEARARLPACASFNIVKLLLKFVHWKGVERPGQRPANTLATSTPSARGASAMPGLKQDPNDPLFNAALWFVFLLLTRRLTQHHERDPNAGANVTDFYAAYEVYCRQQGRKAIPVQELLKIVRAVFKEGSYHPGPPPTVRGFRPKQALLQAIQKSPPVVTEPVVKEEKVAEKQEEMETASQDQDASSASEVTPSAPAEDAMEVEQVHRGDWECCWGHDSNGRAPACSFSFDARDDLFVHVKDVHLAESLSSYDCEWKGCHRIVGTPRRDQIVTHVSIHLLAMSKSKQDALKSPSKQTSVSVHTPSSTSMPQGRPLMNLPQQSIPRPAGQMGQLLQGQTPSHPSAVGHPHVYPDPMDELRGIPLTSLLVLRNLARHPDNRSLYYPYEQQLSGLVAQPRYSKLVASILAQL